MTIYIELKVLWVFLLLFMTARGFVMNISSQRYSRMIVAHNTPIDKDESSFPSILDVSNESGQLTRRKMFSDLLLRSSTASVACCLCCSAPAYGLAQITAAPSESLKMYDLPRNPLQDAMFAEGMAVGMVDYEREAYPTKKRLFQKLFASFEGRPETTIVEVGMGSFPNALFFKQQRGFDIIGVDPNDRMEGYARDSASRAGLLLNNDNNFRVVHGVSEALPLADKSVDAVVCTLTLCSVVDPAISVAEIKRVLKPGGKFLFWEHVLSETDPNLAQQQILLTPNQIKRADGCHLDRQTGNVIRSAGFQALDLEYIELKGFGFLNPTVCGIATA